MPPCSASWAAFPPAYAAEIKKVVVAGATGQTGRRALSLLAKTSGVSVVGGVRDTAKAAKKLSESKIEIRGAMIEKGAAIDASAVELAALDVEKNSVSEMSATLKGADGLVIAVGFVPGEQQQQHTSSIHPSYHTLSPLFSLCQATRSRWTTRQRPSTMSAPLH